MTGVQTCALPIYAAMTISPDGEVMGLGGFMAVTNYPATKKGKNGKTNAMGVFPTMKLRVGKWIIKFSCVGYVTQTVTIIVKARRKVTLSVMMVPIPLPPIV